MSKFGKIRYCPDCGSKVKPEGYENDDYVLRERIIKILDLVSYIHCYECNVRLGEEKRPCGDNDIIIDKAIKILKGEKE